MLKKLLEGELVSISKIITILPTKANRMLLKWETTDAFHNYITRSHTKTLLMNASNSSRLSGRLNLAIFYILLLYIGRRDLPEQLRPIF